MISPMGLQETQFLAPGYIFSREMKPAGGIASRIAGGN
jgi:hypothetical protein